MGASLLEVTRSLHEDMERFQQAILEELEYQPRSVSSFTANFNEFYHRIT